MTIDYPAAADQWHESGCFQSPSALHGWLTGYLASGQRLQPKEWLQEASDYLELAAAPNDVLIKMLEHWYPEVLFRLSQEDMSFECLLPDDEEADLIEQVECLAQWCKGFLDGFGAAGAIKGKLPKDVAEVLAHFDAFSQASVEDEDQENIALFQELCEHAKVAALTVFYGFNQATPVAGATDANKPAIH